MKILGIESSGQVASCAIADEDKIIATIYLDDKLTHSQTLMPLIDRMLEFAQLDIKDIDMIAVSSGPGSFTGLRIGMSTAMGLADGLGVSLIGVSSLEVLAQNICGMDLICPIMDARRGEVYTGVYEHKDEFKIILKPQPMKIEDLIEKLPKDREVMFLGDGVLVYKNIIKEEFENAKFAPCHLLKQNAASLCVRAFELHNKGVEGFEIEYLRKPQAQRELEARLGNE